MSLDPAADSTHLDYALDTMFGRNTTSVSCEFDVKRLDDGRPPWFTLHVRPPLPKDLHKAQLVVFNAEGRRISGIVRRAKRLADDSLQLDVEPD
ncbi:MULTISPECIES: hypothetical protein [Pseudomonas]|jgi:hypothetical protein|uniref:DUF3509 domain-containing protein n=3 Tax=Pseudomonas TaxID=286 RepID=A0ABN5GAR6_PSEO1|nr:MULTISPECIES: hypothetical protein [Pseudomonas]EIK65559.1 hypothetical protein PflQ8_2004 [Pseudomonas fluorescens Q8r1-96]KIR13844.1 hypothetical protein PFLU4_50370 [Pseudomonas fluorescens]AEA68088.1 Conserved hypothetical protein [Pseudomonas brassicacearum subsp. brassicacearum NFM421]AEV63859.1 Hypothetical protein PSF113_3858 [Pseudomonas ogarae]ALQ02750.1 hypothetical protein AK973_2301 [Pseudomonas brassicacearum]